MIYNKVLLDTNICLDVILEREPFAEKSGKIMGKAESGIFFAFLAAHGFDTLFYVLMSKIGRKKAYQGIRILRSVCHIADVTQPVIDKALQLKWPDFEDAIHYQAALAEGCDAIVTRNPSDFKESSLPVFTPFQFLAETDEQE